MRRRDFIKVIAGSAAIWSPRARAQQSPMPVIGFVNARSAEAGTGVAASFRKGLSEAGFVEGQNAAVEYYWLNGQYDRLSSLMADLVRRRVAVIATPATTPAALAAKAATTTIPIVFGVGEDPVALGLVASFAHPGGNATGISIFVFELNAKRLALMHELLPKAMRYAVLLNPGNTVSAEVTLKTIKDAGHALGLDVSFYNASNPEEIDVAFAAFARDKPDALFISGDGFFAARQAQLVTLATRDRIPTGGFLRDMTKFGLLMSYGVPNDDIFRQVGIYCGSILKGTNPADLPVLQSAKFEFVINLQTAKLLGVEVPPTLLARADEVIE
jgi:putative tryptophan/tyrosine transport system substrate-binding protein